MGTISEHAGGSQGVRLVVRKTVWHEGLEEGESVAVNGVCLTATCVTAEHFAVDVSPETLRVTTLGDLHIGSVVNLERAMRLDQRIGGHLLSGHVVGIGIIAGRDEVGNSTVLRIAVDRHLLRYCIVKGSVAVDGVSLTINQVDDTALAVSLIPYTARVTTLGGKDVGDSLNIETDMIGKYIERLSQPHRIG